MSLYHAISFQNTLNQTTFRRVNKEQIYLQNKMPPKSRRHFILYKN